MLAASPASAQTFTSGRTFAFASSGTNVLPLGSQGWTTVTIDKAKRKHVLEIDGSVTYTGNAAIQFLDVFTRVFTPVSSQTDCSGVSFGGSCTVSAHWWVDIDAREAAEPGLWANQPVTVDLQGGVLPADQASNGSYTLRVMMVKK
jgi:hypothetical protein